MEVICNDGYYNRRFNKRKIERLGKLDGIKKLGIFFLDILVRGENKVILS